MHSPLHLFSTKVADITLAELRRGIVQSTGGTDIACVAEHMRKARVRRDLIVTDGWVGRPTGQHRATLAEAKLAVALLGATVTAEDLDDVADVIAPLPLEIPS